LSGGNWAEREAGSDKRLRTDVLVEIFSVGVLVVAVADDVELVGLAGLQGKF
jgi:hypothetical protein